MPTSSLILPFAVQADSNEVFNSNMETALVLLLAEAKRRKLGFLESSEKIMFISKMHYPLWLVPFGGNSLILDGLDTFSSSITYQKLPSLETFIEDVEQGASVREQFRLSLEKHKKTFKEFAGSVEVKLDALISNKELLSAIFEYVKEAASLQPKENVTVTLVPPKLDASTAVERAKQVLNLHSKARSDIMGLEYAKKVLIETASFHEQMMIKEVKFTQESYSKEISELLPTIEEKVGQLEKERDAEIAKMNKALEKMLKGKEKERERRERELQKLELQKTDLTKKRDLRKRRNDKIGLARLEHKIKLCESKIREVKKRIRDLTEFLEETRRQNEADIEKLRRSYQELIDKEKNRITSLEAQRDENVISKQREMDALKLTASQIANQIEELIEKKKKMEKELEGLALPWHIEDVCLVCLPFYLVGYKAGNKTQIRIFSPVTVSSPKGFLNTFKRTLLGFTPASKISLILKLRSKEIDKMLNFALKSRMKSDKAFAEEFRSATASANILVSQRFKETLTKGLEELRAKGWIGQKEIDTMAELYF
ncbi:MAG: hypothetical protein QXX79_02635 [Candidatus Bathyarchaeia archaeon]